MVANEAHADFSCCVVRKSIYFEYKLIYPFCFNSYNDFSFWCYRRYV